MRSRQGIAFLLVLVIVCPIVAGFGWLEKRHHDKVARRLAKQAQAQHAAELSNAR